MISKTELQRIASKRKVKDLAFMEKDYALTWVLKAISMNPALSETLVFKGGTCISKMYAENYRLSEDLDFSLNKKHTLTLNELIHELEKSFETILSEGGPQLHVKNSGRMENKGYLSVRVSYLGPLAHQGEIKLEVSLQEAIIYARSKLPLKESLYPDITPFLINCYGIYEVIAEKIRAILQRGKSRDYYDVWMLTGDQQFNEVARKTPAELIKLVEEKCELNKIEFMPELMFSDTQIKEAKRYWVDSLGRMVFELPEFETVLEDLRKTFFSVDELSLFSKDLEIEHLDNIYRGNNPEPLLRRAFKIVESYLDSKKKSEVLKAMVAISKIAKKEYGGFFIQSIGVLMELQNDRDKEIREEAIALLKKIQNH
jgi:predicted nucleotidyltransferase component of viral defense system